MVNECQRSYERERENYAEKGGNPFLHMLREGPQDRMCKYPCSETDDPDDLQMAQSDVPPGTRQDTSYLDGVYTITALVDAGTEFSVPRLVWSMPAPACTHVGYSSNGT